jgi:hypothetical protein
MRGAFVLQLGSRTEPSRHNFEGCIEEVDTGRELRFRTTEELLAFLGECYELAQRSDRGHRDDRDDPPVRVDKR